MRQFASYEEENIHYWTNRASGYSGVNQEELATDQKRVWGYTISRKIPARFPGRAPGSLRVLDVGTGPGFFAIVLAGMDPLPKVPKAPAAPKASPAAKEASAGVPTAPDAGATPAVSAAETPKAE